MRPPAALLLAVLALWGPLCGPASAAAAAGDGALAPGRRRWVETLSHKPRAYLFHNFLTPEECDHIIGLATPSMRRSTVVNYDGSVSNDDIRNSKGTFLARGSDPVLSAVDRRVAAWAHLPPSHGEDMQVLRYDPGEHYGPHWDELDPTDDAKTVGAQTAARADAEALGGPRVATVLMYLNDVEEGGETAFSHSQWLSDEAAAAAGADGFSECARGRVAARPRKGDALLFFGLSLDGRHLDRASMHTGCDVLRGTKWTASKWIHAFPFRPQNLPAEYRDDLPES